MGPREIFPIWCRVVFVALLVGFVFYKGIGSFSVVNVLGLPFLVAFVVFYDRIHNFLNRK